MKLVCRHCGLPLKPGAEAYCCSGCALADSLLGEARRGRQGPGAMLVAGLGAGFGLVNQGLGWVLAMLLAREVGAGPAVTWALLGSRLAGWAGWGALGVVQSRLAGRRRSDWAVWACAGCVQAMAWRAGWPGWAWAGNLALALWASRGLWFRGAKMRGGR